MKQFVTDKAGEALAALEKGCRWVHFTDPAGLEEIIPACREAEAIVTIPGKYAGDKDTRVHGVILAPGDMGAAAAREFLGPDAIIGCRVSSLFEIMNLAGVDVDFFVVEAPLEEFGQIVNMARSKGVEQRICALTDNTAYLAAGADAIMTGDVNNF